MEFDQKMHRRLGRKLGLRTAGQAQQTLITLQGAACRYGEADTAAMIGAPIAAVPIGANYEKNLAVPNSGNLFQELAIARFYQMNRLKEDILHLRKKYARLRAQIKARRLDLRFKLAVLNGIETDFCDSSSCPSQKDIATSAVCSLSQQVLEAIARFYQMNRLKEDILHLRKKYARLRAQIKARRLDLRFKLAVLNGIETDLCDSSSCPSQKDIATSAVCSLSQQVQMLKNEYEIGEKSLQFRIDQLQWVKRNLEVTKIDNIKAETKNQEVILRDSVNKAQALRNVAQTMYERLLGLVKTFEETEELKHSIIAAKMTLEAESVVTDRDEEAPELRQFKHNLLSRLPPEMLASRDVSCPSEYIIKDLEEFLRLMTRAKALTKIYSHLRAPLAEFKVS
ncbi:unnamed protein product [Notodromas monacha]|uniref:Uncharacterized protein n=1 Tax=Notodromas monacha TaxID=399045 RepID=A0A7R9BLM2_9CRUS|nr:unnamed protein product [Notodromas monacha]CAG0917757.1 unnamed protein product [Notodromas monacha]